MGSSPVTDRLIMGRRNYSCNECHRKFKNKEELFIHAEACIMEAFESEVIAAFNDIPFPAIRNALVLNDVASNIALSMNTPTTGFGITVKKSNAVEREEFVTLKVGDEHLEGDEGGVENRPHETLHKDVYLPKLTTKNDDVSKAQSNESPEGLKVVVSLETNENNESPPTLSAEGSPSARLIQGETNKSEMDGNWEGDDSGDSLLESAEDREREPCTSFNPIKIPHVIGALANAVDDPYKPKMECPTCGLVLYRHNFSTHYRIHTGELPFFCEFCPKRFRTSSSLKVHVRAHTGEKPYVCPMCGYSTITKRNLDRHIENHHVRLGGSRGPATRKSRYRENVVETEWMDDSGSHTEPQYERNVTENMEVHALGDYV